MRNYHLHRSTSTKMFAHTLIMLIIFLHVNDAFGQSVDILNLADVECGVNQYRRGKIVGGGDAAQAEFPWLVSLTRRGNHFCGGSLITRRHVLTAAHCVCNGFDDIIHPASIKITLGQHNLSSSSVHTRVVSVAAIQSHPAYTCTRALNDIAILELDSDVAWSPQVQPACLSTKPTREELATVAGWGWMRENHTKDDMMKHEARLLQKVRVKVLPNEICADWYRSQGKKTKIQSTQMCAGHREGGRDACWADSGGPLMIDAQDNYKLSMIGIVSTGIGCARPYLPGIYTRISEYYAWIQEAVG